MCCASRASCGPNSNVQRIFLRSNAVAGLLSRKAKWKRKSEVNERTQWRGRRTSDEDDADEDDDEMMKMTMRHYLSQLLHQTKADTRRN